MNNKFNMMVAMNGGNAGRAVVSVTNLPLPLPTLPLTGAEGVCGRGIKDDTE